VLLGGLLLATQSAAQVRPPTKPPSKPPSTLPTPTRPSTAAPKFIPKFEVWAETRLLMEGMANANFRSIARQLNKKPADAETWLFLRGQALLVAESGNLLLLRPPRNTGRDTWMKLAMDMRTQAGALAREASSRDWARSKKALGEVANACNRCHQTFRVPVRISPKHEEPERETAVDASVNASVNASAKRRETVRGDRAGSGSGRR
jgi:hypothetical protein